jgi:hypothetical protein
VPDSNARYCSVACEEAATLNQQAASTQEQACIKVPIPHPRPSLRTVSDRQLRIRAKQITPNLHIARRLKPITVSRERSDRDGSRARDSPSPNVGSTTTCQDGTFAATIVSNAPSTTATHLNDSSLKVESLLGDQPRWIEAWRQDVGERAESISPAYVGSSSSAASSNDNREGSSADTLTTKSLLPPSETSATSSELDCVARPHIRSRHSCPPDLSNVRLSPKRSSPRDTITSRPSMILSTKSMSRAVADLTPAVPTPVSPFAPRYQQHSGSWMRSPVLSSAADDEAGVYPGAITTPSIIAPSSDSERPVDCTSILQAVMGNKSVNVRQSKRNGFVTFTPSAMATSDRRRVNLHITTRSQAPAPSSPRQVIGRPRAHTTTSYNPGLESHLSFTGASSPTLTTTLPIKTPTDGISELNLAVLSSPGDTKSTTITDEELLQSMLTPREHNLRRNVTSSGHLSDPFTRTSPVPIPTSNPVAIHSTMQLTRGRRWERDFDSSRRTHNKRTSRSPYRS